MSMRYCQLAQQVLGVHLKTLMHHREGVYDAQDREDLHEMRVASRRLRNALWVFQDVLPSRKRKIWRTSIRRLARKLGPARDLDVKIHFIDQLKRTMKNPSLKAGLEKFLLILKKKRQAMQPGICRALDRLKKEDTVEIMKKAFHRLFQKDDSIKDVQMYGIAKRRIQKRLKQVLKLEVYVHQPARVHELHLIRIAAKKLRYTLENLKSFYGPGIVKFIESAREIQSRLGALHDFDVWRASLPKFVRLPNQDKNLEAAVWFYDRQCQTLRQQTYRQFVQSWDRLKRKKVWDQLTQLVSSTAKRR